MMQEVRTQRLERHIVAMSEINQNDHRDHQHAALEAAAGGKVAVQDDVEDVDQRQRQDLVAAAALYNALYGCLLYTSIQRLCALFGVTLFPQICGSEPQVMGEKIIGQH